MPELSAYVARISVSAEPIFLAVSPTGEHDWVDDPSCATPFPSVREATRHATHLPAKLRAFGLLRRSERLAA